MRWWCWPPALPRPPPCLRCLPGTRTIYYSSIKIITHPKQQLKIETIKGNPSTSIMKRTNATVTHGNVTTLVACLLQSGRLSTGKYKRIEQNQHPKFALRNEDWLAFTLSIYSGHGSWSSSAAIQNKTTYHCDLTSMRGPLRLSVTDSKMKQRKNAVLKNFVFPHFFANFRTLAPHGP